MYMLIRFTDDNPDKGTETKQKKRIVSLIYCLQMITPIRGRKLISSLSDTDIIPERLQMITPIRGRKLI